MSAIDQVGKSESNSSWKTRLRQAKEWRNQGIDKAWDLVELLNSIYEDRDFLAENGCANQDQAAPILDQYVDHLLAALTPQPFLLLRRLMLFAPKDRWLNESPSNLLLEMLRIEEEARSERPAVARRTATIAQLDDANATIAQLRRELVVARTRISELEAELQSVREIVPN